MNDVKVATLAEDVATQAEQLRDQIIQERVEKPPFGDIHSLRRMLETLEQELRDPDTTLGDAC